MKKKLFLFLALTVLAVLMLAVSVSAASYKYKDADGNELYSYDYDTSSCIISNKAGVGFAKEDANGNALTWYITNTVDDGNGNMTYTVAPALTLPVDGDNTSVVAGTINASGTYSYASPVATSNVVSANFPDNMGIKTLNFGTYAGNGNRSISTILFCYLPNTLTTFPGNFVQDTNIIVLDIDFETPVKEIPQNFAHGAYNLTSIKIPSSVEKINGNSPQNGTPFYNCFSLESVTFGPNSQLTTILDHSFDGCKSLVSIELPSTLTTVGTAVFRNTTALESAYLPDAVTSIGNEFFRNSGIIHWPFSENTKLESIGSWAFYDASRLTSAYIPAAIDDDLGVSSQGVGVFTNCTSLQTVKFAPGSKLSALSYTFKNCRALESIEFDLNCPLTVIGNSAFYDCCSLTEIILPHNVEYVHNRAFQCYNTNGILEVVNFGPSFKSFVNDGGDTWFFYKQPKLKTLIFPALNPDNVTSGWIQLINSSATPEIKYTGTLESWTAVLAKIKEVANNNNGTFLGITNPTIITTCEAFYEGNHTGKEAVKFTDGMFVSNANLCIECTRCGNTEEIETVAPLFHFNGFSYEEGTGSGKVMQAFAINKSVLDFYTEKFGAISYGLVAAVNTYYVDETPNTLHDGTLFDVTDGALVAREKVAYVDFTERDYEIFEIAISGLAGNNQNTSVYLCAYAFIDGKVYYLNDESVNEGTAGSSFTIADIKAKVDA